MMSMFLMMLLVVSTGTAWFVALHPGFVWRVVQGGGMADDVSLLGRRSLRLTAARLGVVGVMLVLLTDVWA